MDLATVSIRGRRPLPETCSWQLQGSDLVISGTTANHGVLRDLSGRSLASGMSNGSDLRIPLGQHRGIMVVQLEGDETIGFRVFVPGNPDRR
jgi:hypothetical protein